MQQLCNLTKDMVLFLSTCWRVKLFKAEDMDSSNSELDSVIKESYIPTYILLPDSHHERIQSMLSCSFPIFINVKSGGQLGGDLLTYRCLLNKLQAFDLSKEAPDKAMCNIYLNTEKLKQNGDEFAPKIVENLKIIVAGGDGTAGWLLGVVSDLKLSQPPSIATVSLGKEKS